MDRPWPERGDIDSHVPERPAAAKPWEGFSANAGTTPEADAVRVITESVAATGRACALGLCCAMSPVAVPNGWNQPASWARSISRNQA